MSKGENMSNAKLQMVNRYLLSKLRQSLGSSSSPFFRRFSIQTISLGIENERHRWSEHLNWKCWSWSMEIKAPRLTSLFHCRHSSERKRFVAVEVLRFVNEAAMRQEFSRAAHWISRSFSFSVLASHLHWQLNNTHQNKIFSFGRISTVKERSEARCFYLHRSTSTLSIEMFTPPVSLIFNAKWNCLNAEAAKEWRRLWAEWLSQFRQQVSISRLHLCIWHVFLFRHFPFRYFLPRPTDQKDGDANSQFKISIRIQWLRVTSSQLSQAEKRHSHTKSLSVHCPSFRAQDKI